MISDLSELETSPHRSLRELNHQRDQKKTQRKFVPKF